VVYLYHAAPVRGSFARALATKKRLEERRAAGDKSK